MDKLLPCQALKKKKLKKHTVTGKGRLPFTGSKNWVRHTWIPLRGEYSQKEPKKKKKHVPITNNDRWYLWLIIILLFLFENGGRLHDESKIWSGLRPCTLMYCMRDPCQLLCVCIASLKKKNPSFRKFDPVSYLLLEIRWVPLLEIKRNHYSIFSAKFIGPESDKAVQKFPE